MKNKLTYTLVTVLLLISTKANADFFEFQDLDDFLTQFPNHLLEEFEEANVADGASAVIGNTLNSMTSNDVFQSGDIVDGLQIRVAENGAGDNLFVSGPGFANYESHAVSYNSTGTVEPQITVDFLDENVRGFSFDLTSNPDGNDITVNLFSGDTNLGSFLVPNVVGAGTFFGGFSNSDLITRVELSSGTNFFGVDNIRFSAVPEPSSVLLFLSLSASLWCTRSRRRCS